MGTDFSKPMNGATVRSVIMLIFVLCASVLASLLLGAQPLHFGDILHAPASFSHTIFFHIRLPRTLLALLAGALLSGAGACFQQFFRNPLAEPGIMGISSGASLGAVIASTFGTGTVLAGILSPVNFGAFLGAILAGFFVTVLAGYKNGTESTVSLLLCGTALGTLYSALIAIILSLNDSRLHTMYIWMLGSFSGRGWNEVLFILVPSFLSIVLFFVCIPRLDALCGGEVSAVALGVHIVRLRVQIIIAGAIACSAAVCAGGTIGFVGLVAPHTVRKLCGVKAKTLVPLSMIGGASLMLISDTLCRICIPPSEIPVGTVTSLIGAPFFISLLVSKRRQT